MDPVTSPPLSEAGRTAAFDAVRGSYERVNLHWPGRVFWASSPLAGELLAAELARRYTPRADRLRRIASWLGGMALPIVAGALLYGGSAAVCAGWTSVWAWVMAPDSALASDSDVPWRGAWIGVAAAGLLLAVGLVVSMVRYTDDGYARDGMGFFIAVMTGLSGAFVFPAFLGGLAGAFVGHLLDATGGGPPRSWVTTLLIATAAGTTLAAAVLGSMVKWQATSPRPLRHVDSAYGRLRRNYFDSAGSYGVDVALARTVDWTARARRPWIWRYPVEHFDRQSGH
jgi:hypothetical protein